MLPFISGVFKSGAEGWEVSGRALFCGLAENKIRIVFARAPRPTLGIQLTLDQSRGGFPIGNIDTMGFLKHSPSTFFLTVE